jgi:thiol-disulfide isomerase/thioredoxin
MFFSLFAFGVFLSLPATALNCGSKAPNLQVSEWIRNGPVQLIEAKDSKALTVIDFWATWCPPCRQTIPLLLDIQAKYRERGVVVVGVSREGKAVVEEFLKGFGDINYAVGIDDQGKTTAAYMADETSIPLAFLVDGEARVVWKGHPINLERVLARVLAGTFDAKTEEKIVKTRDKLQQAFQTANESEIEKTSEELLKLDPEDVVAIQMRLFVFEKKNQFAQALKFLDERIAASPNFAPLLFLKLDVLSKNDAEADVIRACANQVLERFRESPETMEGLARMLVFDFPFGLAPLDIAILAAETATKSLPDDVDPLRKTGCLETLAKAYSSVGRMDKAIETQSRAFESAKGTPRKSEVERILEWYRRVQATGEGLK